MDLDGVWVCVITCQKDSDSHLPDEDGTKLYSWENVFHLLVMFPFYEEWNFSSLWQPIGLASDVIKYILRSLYKFCPEY